MSKILKRRFYPFLFFLLFGLVNFISLYRKVSAVIDEESKRGSDAILKPSPDAVLKPSGLVELKNPLGTENIIDVINNILNYLIYISVPILAFMILWGGFQILTARDDPEKVKNGRKTIQWASIGFAVILISKGVALILLKILKG